MKSPKIYSIVSEHRSSARIYTGTLPQLIEVFSYKLECGNSWNPKIPRQPKTFNSLLSALDKCVEELQGGCFYRDSYREATNYDFEHISYQENLNR